MKDKIKRKIQKFVGFKPNTDNSYEDLEKMLDELFECGRKLK